MNVRIGGTENLLKLFFTLAISIIIVLTVINIAISGIQYMTQEANIGKKGEAKKRLQNSIIALMLGLLSYTILYTVNKQLVEFTFNPAGIDADGSINQGIAAAVAAQQQSAALSSTFSGIEAIMTPVYQVGNPGYAAGPTWSNPYFPGQTPNTRPTFAETTTNGNFSTFASAGSIKCSGTSCTARSTVFGYKDGDGTVGKFGDNGIGNSLWSDKLGCAFDTGNTFTMGVALPQSFWGAAGIPISEVKYLGIKVSINGVFQKILPVVDDSQENLDFTFAAAKAYIDPTITTSNHLNTAGKTISFEIVKDYYKTNLKQNVVYTSNKSTGSNKIPCTI